LVIGNQQIKKLICTKTHEYSGGKVVIYGTLIGTASIFLLRPVSRFYLPEQDWPSLDFGVKIRNPQLVTSEKSLQNSLPEAAILVEMSNIGLAKK
jgi:hypothetical protein